MRAAAGLSVTGFCALAGIPRTTSYRRRAAADRPTRSRPAPVRDRIEQPAAQLALEWPTWGNRKIWALLATDGHQASQATVRRALARRGLLQPADVQRERRELARARKAAFVEPVTRRNRVWETDFSACVIERRPAADVIQRQVEAFLCLFRQATSRALT